MSTTNDDPYLWLENVSGDNALAWVRERNAVSTAKLESSPGFSALQDRLLTILNSRERIPSVAKIGKFYYNFWRDDKNVRGLWRRTTLGEYKKANTAWETVLDLDQLASREKENWVWHGYTVLEPSYDRCLIEVSRGGADAAVVREFDLTTLQFVTDGFTVPEAKTDVAWHDRDTVYIGSDFGPGSLTSSGYPRVIKQWRRGTPLSEATTIFEGKPEDVEVGISVDHDHGQVYELINRGVTFFSGQTFLHRGDQWVRLEKPDDATVRTFGKFILLELRSDWNVGGKTYVAGSLLAENMDDFLGGSRDFSVVFRPSARSSLSAVTATKHYLGLTELENVHSQPYWLRFEHGEWMRTAMAPPAFGTVSISGIDENESDDYFMTLTDFLTPSSLFMGVAGKPETEKLKALPSFFDARGLEIQQFDATSKDGTRVPYFQVGRKGLQLDGTNVTLLNGYGGFEIAMLPNYNPVIGTAWLERGGIYVLANIRGGGEFGPKWHEAARKQNRQRAYDDFIAVAEDLIKRGVTSPKHLGIEGRSNGGLLMGVMLTERPDLFGAVHCGSPLLDMRRFNKLLAGASWMDEYGDPDKPEDWAYIQKYSPYQNVAANKNYPPILITTSTRDDRVHPGHARKMAARLAEQGHEVLYYENTEGGHGAAANNKQSAFMQALAYTFLWNELSR
ncbi:MAG TPA: prolyl oligopeptidase family serine peptidase [Verrucomicrobiae bacterium]|nr:prolyl oligopeptidase family serine peptidase [Verrucomicrobiae bacterium]